MRKSKKSDFGSHSEQIRQWADRSATDREKWRTRSQYFHQLDEEYLRFLLPKGLRVLALGCGTGRKLASVEPSVGVGVDLSQKKLSVAAENYPKLVFIEGDIENPEVLGRAALEGPFDAILLYDTLGFLHDIEAFLSNIRNLCTQETRIISVYFAYFWEPILKAAERLRIKMPTMDVTWLRMADVERFMELSRLETVKKEWRILMPIRAFGFGTLINRYFATLPFVRKFSLRHYLVARVMPAVDLVPQSVSIVVPCRNERGNIEPAVRRIPHLGSKTEIIFVEGHSTDGTFDEIQRVMKEWTNLDIHVIRQPGRGKGDAVRAGFSVATGDILMILDADLTVRPEDLAKFYREIESGRGEFINGTRLIYPMKDEAMRLLNYIANRIFAVIFSFILNQTFTDTLCGTKALSKKNYEKIYENRKYFGDFDPFGDFDLIFGATKLNLKVVEIPIRYNSRIYGETQISRFRHGFLLIRMVIFAYRKLKIV